MTHLGSSVTIWARWAWCPGQLAYVDAWRLVRIVARVRNLYMVELPDGTPALAERAQLSQIPPRRSP